MDGDAFFRSTAKVAKSAKIRAEKRASGQGKRGTQSTRARNGGNAKHAKRAKDKEDDIHERGAVFDDDAAAVAVSDESDDEPETAAEKRVRMAKQLVARFEAEEAELADDQDVDRDAVAHRLKQDLQAQRGVLRRTLACKLLEQTVAAESIITTLGHRLPLTCVALASDGETFVTGSKDGSIIKWNRYAGMQSLSYPLTCPTRLVCDSNSCCQQVSSCITGSASGKQTHIMAILDKYSAWRCRPTCNTWRVLVRRA
jgi:ribosomal RNA-processing protein 9